jgi:hypothetical protein
MIEFLGTCLLSGLIGIGALLLFLTVMTVLCEYAYYKEGQAEEEIPDTQKSA